jgi:hypothetical protein
MRSASPSTAQANGWTPSHTPCSTTSGARDSATPSVHNAGAGARQRVATARGHGLDGRHGVTRWHSWQAQAAAGASRATPTTARFASAVSTAARSRLRACRRDGTPGLPPQTPGQVSTADRDRRVILGARAYVDGCRACQDEPPASGGGATAVSLTPTRVGRDVHTPFAMFAAVARLLVLPPMPMTGRSLTRPPSVRRSWDGRGGLARREPRSCIVGTGCACPGVLVTTESVGERL